MRKLMLVLLVMLVALSACGKKQEPAVQTEEETPQFIFFPLPTFAQVFDKLALVQTSDYTKALPKTYEKVEGDTYKQAYQLGALTADAIFCTEGKDDSRLNEIALEMIYYADMLNIREQISPLTDKLTQLLQEKKWDEMKTMLESERQNVVAALHEKGEYDTFMLLQLGGWTTALYDLTYLLLDGEFNPDKTAILFEIGTLNQLISNYETIPSDRVKQREFYAPSLAKLQEIRGILLNKTDERLTREEVTSINTLSHDIQVLFK